MTPISTITPLPAQQANASGWHSHDGILDPEIPGDTLVQVCFRDGDIAFGLVHDWDQNWQWAHSKEGLKAAGAIIAWRPHLAPGSTDLKADSMPDQATETDSRAEGDPPLQRNHA